jgi:hypothetical protein
MKIERIPLAALAIVGLGIVLNERTIALWFSTDGTVESKAFIVAIRIFQSIAIAYGGGILLAYRFFGPRWPGWILSRTALLLMGMLISLLVTEGLVRKIMPTPFALFDADRFFMYHEMLGHVFEPNKEAMYTIPFESQTRVAINSKGMRNPEVNLAKAPGIKRLAVLGDSFTSNMAVEQNQVFTEVMNRLLGGTWEVLNFGVDGYSTVQEWLSFSESAIDLDPDAVMILFYLRNDLGGNTGWGNPVSYSPLARLDPGGELEVYNVPCPVPPQLVDRSENRSILQITDFHLYNLARKTLSVRDHVLVNAYPEIPLFDKRISDATAQSWTLFEAILSALKQDCERHGIPLILVNAPTILQVYEEEYWAPILESRNLQDDYDLGLPSKIMADVSGRLDVAFVDLLPPLKEHAANGEILYYRIFQHWNALGNRRVGKILADYVAEHLQ